MSKKKSNSPGSILMNLLTIVVLIGTLAVIAASLIIYYQPYSTINPFPPATMPVALFLPSSTPTSEPRLPSSTVTPVVMNTAVQPSPTESPTRTARPTIWSAQKTTDAPLPSLPVSSTPTSVPMDPSSAYRYRIQAEPEAISADIFDSSRSDCKWVGVAGQVNDLEGSPVTGILVLLGGSLEFQTINQTTITGTARNYGPAGYEFTLTDHLVKSNDVVWVQLVDQSYIPLSPRVTFDTFDDCSKSLIIINFKQVR